jgi:AraC-like DNA-binding protein
MAVKVTRDGRIVLWEGASLWSFDVVPTGTRTNRMHAHHAFQLTFSAGGSANIRGDRGLVHGPAILIAPDIPHAIEPEGRIALLFVDPEGYPGATLRQLVGGEGIVRLPADRSIELLLAGLWHDPAPSTAEVERVGRDVLRLLTGEEETVRALDPRIQRVVDWISAGAGGERASVTDAAGIACLSASRFSHLFVAEVGLPFRTYLLWRRLMRAVAGMAGGGSLTEAAHAAGFADSAHFSRTFHRMFGLPAATLDLGPPRE